MYIKSLSMCFLVKCLSPNGLFPDPTNEFGYINCTAGSAKRVPCGVGMKWEDETKSCQLKGERMNVVLKVLKLPRISPTRLTPIQLRAIISCSQLIKWMFFFSPSRWFTNTLLRHTATSQQRRQRH
jgi:hypothetical protein